MLLTDWESVSRCLNKTTEEKYARLLVLSLVSVVALYFSSAQCHTDVERVKLVSVSSILSAERLFNADLFFCMWSPFTPFDWFWPQQPCQFQVFLSSVSRWVVNSHAIHTNYSFISKWFILVISSETIRFWHHLLIFFFFTKLHYWNWNWNTVHTFESNTQLKENLVALIDWMCLKTYIDKCDYSFYLIHAESRFFNALTSMPS